MKQTGIRYGNCILGVLYLWVRGKIKRVVKIKRDTGWFPWHFGIISKKGNFIHFYKVVPANRDKAPPFWFRGSFQVWQIDDANLYLTEMGVEARVWKRFGILRMLGLFLLVYFPFIIGWILWPHCLIIKHTVLGWRRRR